MLRPWHRGKKKPTGNDSWQPPMQVDHPVEVGCASKFRASVVNSDVLQFVEWYFFCVLKNCDAGNTPAGKDSCRPLSAETASVAVIPAASRLRRRRPEAGFVNAGRQMFVPVFNAVCPAGPQSNPADA